MAKTGNLDVEKEWPLTIASLRGPAVPEEERGMSALPNGFMTFPHGYRPVHIAAHIGQRDTLDLLSGISFRRSGTARLDQPSRVCYCCSDEMYAASHLRSRFRVAAVAGLGVHEPSQYRGYTTLHLALHGGSKESVLFLLDTGADGLTDTPPAEDYIAPDEDYGLTALHELARLHHVDDTLIDLVDNIIEKTPVNVQTQTTCGFSPLVVAIACFQVRLAIRLIGAGAPVHEPGLNLLHLLLKTAVSVTWESLGLSSKLASQARSRSETSMRLDLERLGDLVQILIHNGVDANQRDAYGLTPLHRALPLGVDTGVLAALLPSVDVTIGDMHGQLPWQMVLAFHTTTNVDFFPHRTWKCPFPQTPAAATPGPSAENIPASFVPLMRMSYEASCLIQTPDAAFASPVPWPATGQLVTHFDASDVFAGRSGRIPRASSKLPPPRATTYTLIYNPCHGDRRVDHLVATLHAGGQGATPIMVRFSPGTIVHYTSSFRNYLVLVESNTLKWRILFTDAPEMLRFLLFAVHIGHVVVKVSKYDYLRSAASSE